MFGDCQVMSTTMGGGNVMMNSEALFSTQIQNPNFSFMNNISSYNPFSAVIPKEEAMMMQRNEARDEEIESGSGSGPMDGGSAEEQEDEQQPKRKRYHRHTPQQIAAMEALFKECQHPDDKQRQKLSLELGLKPRQVKFWFQNRRTQMKAQQDKADNMVLRAENQELKNESYRLQAAMRNLTCPNCGSPATLGEMSVDEHHLRFENMRLKEELERVNAITARYIGRPIDALIQQQPPSMLLPNLDLDMNMYSRHFQGPMGGGTEMIPPMPAMPTMPENSNIIGGNLIMEQEKAMAVELAMHALEELLKMSKLDEPLWMRSSSGGKDVLNLEEHARMFPWPMNGKQHQCEFRREVTRDSALVIMNSITLVDAFLDANKWMELFPSIVSRAKKVQIITPGVAGQVSGSLHLMYAELHALSPLVPTREAYFLRYCEHNVNDETWAIVDFPIDSIHTLHQLSLPKYLRRPSGCIIRDMPNGYSKVTWLEHAEVEDKPVHQIFNNFVSNGTAFGAQRWLSVLQQQCERLASLMARNISDIGVISSPEARRNLMKLAHRMIKTFSAGITPSGGQSWTAVSDNPQDTVRVTTRKNTEPGQPIGLILYAVSTTWLPFPHQQVFDLLRDERRRSQLDVLSSGTSSHEVAHIATGSYPGNCISLIRLNASSNSSQNVELMLQESSTDQAGSLVVYSILNVDAVQQAMNGEDPSYVPILPLGFVITPVSSPKNSYGNGNGLDDGNVPMPSCLLTVGLQVLASASTSAKINLSDVNTVNNHICDVSHQISAALHSNIGISIGGGEGGGVSNDPTGGTSGQ